MDCIKEKEGRCLAFRSFTKREIRQFSLSCIEGKEMYQKA